MNLNVETENALEETILQLLHERAAGKTICPSEAARTVAGDGELSMDRAAIRRHMQRQS